MLEKLETQKCDRTLHRKKQQKERSPAPIYPHTELAPTSPQQLSQARLKGGGTIGRTGLHQNQQRRTTAKNLKYQPGAEIAMSRKQQPNSIESQPLITYNLNQMQQAVFTRSIKLTCDLAN
ncbi:hypothetical protein QT970_05900 [Microcoleus sp. herbarium8]|uniref:hypothetical protein n=1 Tax=Microcoleus sp. herbarium8 TaxID=3055436 RepID=UPI002FD1C38B